MLTKGLYLVLGKAGMQHLKVMRVRRFVGQGWGRMESNNVVVNVGKATTGFW